MNFLYEISGTFNANPIKTKHFKSYRNAVEYLDNLFASLNVQIEEVLSTNNKNTYVANDYSRFTLTRLA